MGVEVRVEVGVEGGIGERCDVTQEARKRKEDKQTFGFGVGRSSWFELVFDVECCH